METIFSLLFSAAIWFACLYLPGWCWSPWLLATERTSNGAQLPARLFVEVAVSTAATSWIGFVLLEAGFFSSGALVAALTVVSALGWVLSRGECRLPYGRTNFVFVLVAIVMVPFFFPPYHARMGSSDATGYLAAGIHVAQSGTLVVHDPTVTLMEPDLRRAFFPSVAFDRGSPPYLRLEGGYILRSLDSGDVLPAFHHGIVPWVALAVATIGEARAEWVFSAFGVLSCVAVWAAATTLGLGRRFSALALLATASQAPFLFYARFPMPEVPASFFLWSGVALSGCVKQPRLLTLAGFLLGCAGLLRMENAFFAAAAVIALLAMRPTKELVPLILGTLVLTAHAITHAALWRTHYWGNLRGFFLAHWEVFPAFLLAFLTAYALGSRSRARGALLAWVAKAWFPCAVIGLVIYSWHFGPYDPWRLLLYWCGPIPVLAGFVALGVAGIISDKLATHLTAWLTAFAAAVFLLAPNATPVDLWVVRRLVPIVLPGLALLAWLAVAACLRRFPVRKQPLVVGIIIAAWFTSSVLPLWRILRQPYYASARTHEAMLTESLASPCVALVHGSVAPLSFPPLVWAKRSCPIFYFRTAPQWELVELLVALHQQPAAVYLITPADQSELPRTNAVGRWVPLLTYTFPLASPFLSPDDALPWKEVGLSVYRWVPP